MDKLARLSCRSTFIRHDQVTVKHRHCEETALESFRGIQIWI